MKLTKAFVLFVILLREALTKRSWKLYVFLNIHLLNGIYGAHLMFQITKRQGWGQKIDNHTLKCVAFATMIESLYLFKSDNKISFSICHTFALYVFTLRSWNIEQLIIFYWLLTDLSPPPLCIPQIFSFFFVMNEILLVWIAAWCLKDIFLFLFFLIFQIRLSVKISKVLFIDLTRLESFSKYLLRIIIWLWAIDKLESF